MPQLSSITVTEEHSKKIKAVIENGKYGLSSFMQMVLNYYFDGSNAVVKRDFVIFMAYPVILDVLLWFCFVQSQITIIFYIGLLSLGLTIATTWYVIDKYKNNLRGEK